MGRIPRDHFARFDKRVLLGISMVLCLMSPVAARSQGLDFVTAFGTPGMYPRGVAVDPTGSRVYVTDNNAECVRVFSSEGTYLASWGTSGNNPGQFVRPDAIAVDANGNVYVGDGQNSGPSPFERIQVFTSTGAFIRQWSSWGIGPGQFTGPLRLAVDASANVYVTEGWKRLQVFTDSGTYLFGWGSYGSLPGQFEGASYIAIGPSQEVYVGDFILNRVQRFTSTGAFVSQFGCPGKGDGGFSLMSGLATDRSGLVYVADLTSSRLQVFTGAGTYLAQTGGPGTGNGQFYNPLGVAASVDGSIYVADPGNERIQKFRALPVAAKTTSWGRMKALYR